MVEHMDHPLFRITTLLKPEIGGERFNATGFFVSVEDSVYLVSNRHVFEHELGITADRIFIRYLPNEGEWTTEMEAVELAEGDWLTHSSDDADVAVLPVELTELDFGKTGNLAIPREKFISRLTDMILSGNSAIVVGYPEAGWYSQNKSPLVRNALISSFFGTKFNDDMCFVTDAKMHDGMSGSPVLTAPSAIIHNVEGDILRFRYEDLEDLPGLVGIHSGPVEQDNELDLHRVWYTDIIEDIIDERS